MNTEAYDINARATETLRFDQARPLLQTLLQDRFKLVVHHETREMVVYELRPDKTGLKIAASKAGNCVLPRPENLPSGSNSD